MREPRIACGILAGPLVFDVTADERLHLWRKGGDGHWLHRTLADGVRAFDVRQAVDGTLSIALALTRADGDILGLAHGLDPALGAEGWRQLLRTMTGPRLPAGVLRLTFGVAQAGAPTMVVAETPSGDWYCNALAAGDSLHAIPAPMPGMRRLAVGACRLPGQWQRRGDDTLGFASLDRHGRNLAFDYPGAPKGIASVLPAAGVVPDVPDLFVAGESIVVYRGLNPLPMAVAAVADARLLWSAANRGGEFLAYGDASDATWLVARAPNGAWRAPGRLACGRAALAASDNGGLHAVTVEEGVLTVARFTPDGTPAGRAVLAAP
ncbi:hypothetical protein [Pseudoduganella buxea]|uniref:DUF1513 domain-containing protein n=1 Tax=Pseudoduganella buxea TaxID=1949069 RepID=A0A6I3ST18_9BURK|nr:hypothetical protein [Pseudoduganella buxea]MTV52303.1 hypothetical protein [Pseudoduganella buxea]GGB86540.1 hypothetical protein GCM10011572_05640 [Pseudoduganella buxea]